jgi:hypothetical protein
MLDRSTVLALAIALVVGILTYVLYRRLARQHQAAPPSDRATTYSRPRHLPTRRF